MFLKSSAAIIKKFLKRFADVINIRNVFLLKTNLHLVFRHIKLTNEFPYITLGVEYNSQSRHSAIFNLKINNKYFLLERFYTAAFSCTTGN